MISSLLATGELAKNAGQKCPIIDHPLHCVIDVSPQFVVSTEHQ
jgi:hypothetical protein